MIPREQTAARRAAGREAIERFCVSEGFPTPTLQERSDRQIVFFFGKAPDGREFGIGYEAAGDFDEE